MPFKMSVRGVCRCQFVLNSKFLKSKKGWIIRLGGWVKSDWDFFQNFCIYFWHHPLRIHKYLQLKQLFTCFILKKISKLSNKYTLERWNYYSHFQSCMMFTTLLVPKVFLQYLPSKRRDHKESQKVCNVWKSSWCCL